MTIISNLNKLWYKKKSDFKLIEIHFHREAEAAGFCSPVPAGVPLNTQRSHTFSLCFHSPCFRAIMKFLMQTRLTHSFCLPLCSYLLTVKKSCREESSSREDRVGGLSCSSLLALWHLQRSRHIVSVHVPSRSSCSKLVLCWDRVPPLSTTASSSFLCQTHKSMHKRTFTITRINLMHTVLHQQHSWGSILQYAPWLNAAS